MIRCINISKIFPSKKGDVVALSDVTFFVKRAEFVCIVGPSGCGKSTLLRIVANLTKPTKGSILFDDSQSRGKESIHPIMVFQDHSLLPWMSVVDNVALGLMASKVSRSTRRQHALNILNQFGLEGFENRKVSELSGGMQQRAALARAFLANPEVLLMDEPFRSLDTLTKLILQQELLSIWSKNQKTIIYITHDIDEAITLADRILIMTKRPGCILTEINIDLPRPRTPQSIQAKEITKIKWQIWQLLEHEARDMLNK